MEDQNKVGVKPTLVVLLDQGKNGKTRIVDEYTHQDVLDGYVFAVTEKMLQTFGISKVSRLFLTTPGSHLLLGCSRRSLNEMLTLCYEQIRLTPSCGRPMRALLPSKA